MRCIVVVLKWVFAGYCQMWGKGKRFSFVQVVLRAALGRIVNLYVLYSFRSSIILSFVQLLLLILCLLWGLEPAVCPSCFWFEKAYIVENRWLIAVRHFHTWKSEMRAHKLFHISIFEPERYPFSLVLFSICSSPCVSLAGPLCVGPKSSCLVQTGTSGPTVQV